MSSVGIFGRLVNFTWPMLHPEVVVVVLDEVMAMVMVVVATVIGRGNGSQENNSNNSGSHSNLQCQLRWRKGHVVRKCFKLFDRSSGEEKSTAPATTSYGIDTNWYADSGTTNHIMSDLDKLSVCYKYGGDQVHTANGSGKFIRHIGSTTLHTPSRELILKNILHVPAANKNLVSIHHFAYDNQVFFELHPWYFLIKDQKSKMVLHHGKVEGVCILSSSLLENKSLVQSRCHLIGGITDWVILSPP
jgi:hypothetical protein